MLRIGKNASEEKSKTQTSAPDPTTYPTSRSYTPNSSGETHPRLSNGTVDSPKAMTESETLAREIKEGTLGGFVGSGTMVSGEVTFKAMLRVDGNLSGRVTSSAGTLIVGAGGQVDANIDVAVATVHGTVNGDIVTSQRVELGRAAKVNGNIQTASLVIEQGAIFEGTCKMIKPKAAIETDMKAEKRAEVLEASALRRISTDGAGRKAEIANVAAVAAS